MRRVAGLRRASGWTGVGARVATVLGAQWGDEGKGKLVDILARDYDIVARFNGGANAGHTLVVDGTKFAFHLLPCGMLYPDKRNVIGNGVVLHVPTLLDELQQLDDHRINHEGRLLISNRAHLLFDFHKTVDGLQETRLSDRQIGTTKKGIGPCYASKMTRRGVRVGTLMQNWSTFESAYRGLLEVHQEAFDFEHDGEEELQRFKEYRERLQRSVCDTAFLINDAIRKGQTVLAEGANAALLDVDFGTYPYVTSSSTTVGGVSTGLGIAPQLLESNIGVVKAYTTRVGGGPFPTELRDATGELLQKQGHEFGTTTGRARRCGWLDLPVVQYSTMINGHMSLNLTKLDVLTGLDTIQIGIQYRIDGRVLGRGEMPSTLEELARVHVDYETLPGWTEDITQVTSFDALPQNAQRYVERIEQLAQLPVSWIGVGPGREAMICKGFEYGK